jgi:hypothetical protein
MSKEIPAGEVFGMIRDLVDRMETATLYIRTDKNRAVMVATKGGEIITLSSGPRHGAKAIPILRDMRTAAVRVEGHAISYHSEHMPPTAVLMAMLETDSSDQAEAGGESTGASGGAAVGVADRVKTVLSQLLSEYLGPVAPICCEQVMESLGNPSDADRLRLAVEKMAAEAGSPEEAQAFTLRAWKRLNL